jgi:hypothetical protein
MKTICICGGGSLGHVMAAVLGSQEDIKINILTGHPEAWNESICATDTVEKKYSAVVNKATANASDVIPESDIILFCLPGYLIRETLLKIHPYAQGKPVGSVVSSTGFFQNAEEILGSKASLYGFQRVPFIARVREYGKSADLLGYKKELLMATENIEDDFIGLWSSWLMTPVHKLNNKWEAILSNSNPLLHTSRLYSLWHHYETEIYAEPILFYEQWDDESSELYVAMDSEFQQLCKRYEAHIPDVLTYYESNNPQELTRKLKSIAAFKGIPAPMKQTEKGWTPDFTSRYFTEDFPYGLQLIKDLAIKNNLSTPTIDMVLQWGRGKIYERLSR